MSNLLNRLCVLKTSIRSYLIFLPPMWFAAAMLPLNAKRTAKDTKYSTVSSYELMTSKQTVT